MPNFNYKLSGTIIVPEGSILTDTATGIILPDGRILKLWEAAELSENGDGFVGENLLDAFRRIVRTLDALLDRVADANLFHGVAPGDEAAWGFAPW